MNHPPNAEVSTSNLNKQTVYQSQLLCSWVKACNRPKKFERISCRLADLKNKGKLVDSAAFHHAFNQVWRHLHGSNLAFSSFIKNTQVLKQHLLYPKSFDPSLAERPVKMRILQSKSSILNIEALFEGLKGLPERAMVKTQDWNWTWVHAMKTLGCAMPDRLKALDFLVERNAIEFKGLTPNGRRHWWEELLSVVDPVNYPQESKDFMEKCQQVGLDFKHSSRIEGPFLAYLSSTPRQKAHHYTIRLQFLMDLGIPWDPKVNDFIDELERIDQHPASVGSVFGFSGGGLSNVVQEMRSRVIDYTEKRVLTQIVSEAPSGPQEGPFAPKLKL